ncbi:hypothetical protein [Planomicrobium sp. YIM 101495]|uniref:hypothetical protein n=1 Tax=Planomicrobium sp. YIM 101495 TaxID=2665160 RepID=UPI0012B8DC1B|nr:hypothetical protein [Planomicrobium sp. YIM 101495]MTD30533.1 hypothetical protein [Planomicrobium sp. YIM 101495]
MNTKLVGACFALFFLLTGCNDEPVEPEVEVPELDPEVMEEEIDGVEEEPAEVDEQEVEEPQETPEADPMAYLPEDGAVKNFKGEGNEYAELTIEVEHLDEKHIAMYEDNGGTRVLRIYRISEQQIDLVLEQPEFYEMYEDDPTGLDVIGTYLKFPLEVGQTSSLGEIMETDGTVETPYRTFEEVVIFESEEQEGSINRYYFVEGYGEVKREFIMDTEEGEMDFIVTSALESIE